MNTTIATQLFKRGTGGEIRVWSVEQNGSRYRTLSGIDGGAITASGWTTCDAKNVGRANETTPKSQAMIEVAAAYEKKLAGGYFLDRADVDNVTITKPMLAADWAKRRNKVVLGDGVWAQPKLDGIRCIVRGDGMWTRAGKPITSCPHIYRALAPVFKADPHAVLDGELYNHDLKHDFNKITSLVRKQNPTVEQCAEAEGLIQYHVYDVVQDRGYADRRDWICHNVPEGNHIRIVDSTICTAQHILDALYASWMEDGYEGQMIRLDGPYENKRSNLLLKRKEFDTAEFPVIAIEEGNGNWAGCAKRFIIGLGDGKQCGAGVKGKRDSLKSLWSGESETPTWATVRYFGKTPDGSLRFPVVIDYGTEYRED